MRDINGYEGKYAVDEEGRVYSYPNSKNKSFRELKPILSNIGKHYRVALYTDSKPALKQVHRLVAETYIDNTDNKPQVNHIDGDKSNNSVANLEWVTCSENAQHAFDIGLRRGMKGDSHPSRKVSTSDVKNIRGDTRSARIIALEYGISQGQVYRIKNKKSWSHI